MSENRDGRLDCKSFEQDEDVSQLSENQGDQNLGKFKRELERRLSTNGLDCDEIVQLAASSVEVARLIKALVLANRDMIDETELAHRISHEIIHDIEKDVDHHLKIYSKYTLQSKVDSAGSASKFFNLISLLKDVSILGRILLEASSRFESYRSRSPIRTSSCHNLNLDHKSHLSYRCDDATSEDPLTALIESSSSDDFLILSWSLESIPLRDMILAVHILIKSHECFTLAHDIQGVVVVLGRIKFMIRKILAPKNQMELVTKLLTSIGRYREMNYVFDLFRDRSQFELLLSKGVEKTPELRIALFNYVKRNPEYHALVTLNFSMFREIAESLESSAMKRLDKLIFSEGNNEHYLEEKQKHRSFQRTKESDSMLSPLSPNVADRVRSKSGERRKKERPELHTWTQDTSGRHLTRQQRSSATIQNISDDAGHRTASAVGISFTSMIKSPGFEVRHKKQLHQQLPDKKNEPSCSGHKRMNADEFGASAAEFVAASATLESDTAASDDCDKKRALYSKEGLNLCLVEMVDASDCFAKAGCYKRSNSCKSQAKLIALQLALIDSGTNVLQLKQSELNDLIVSFESFPNAYIVADAYNYHLAWHQALFVNVILRAQQSTSKSLRYLNEYCKKCDLSSTLVMELIFLYKQHTANHDATVAVSLPTDGGSGICGAVYLGCATNNETCPPTDNQEQPTVARYGENEVRCSAANQAAGLLCPQIDDSVHDTSALANAMKLIIARLTDVELRCKIYSQLNFLDAKEELLCDPATRAYLKDLKQA